MTEKVVSTLPCLPGVYLFKNASGHIIYIGKAKSLKKRVSSYFTKQKSDWKIAELIKEHASIAHIITTSETEALLLEAQLIRDYKPKFNVLLKSGQPFLYLLFTAPETGLAHLVLTRNKKKKGRYFGPFLHKSDARAVFDYLTRTFKLTLCNKTIENGCLDYHLGRCAGNCKKDFNAQAYLFNLELAHNALKGDHKKFITSIEEEIQRCNKKLEFERSAHLQKYIEHFETIFATIKARFSEKKYYKEVEHATTQEIDQKASHNGLVELQSILKLDSTPLTIDCFDISHFQSTHLVGSCIRFTNGIKDPNNFRRFKIKSLSRQNDYAALQEIVHRRYRDSKNLPDVIFIDGGKGQRNAIKALFPSTPCISLAKREEILFTDYHPEGLHLDIQTDLGKLLIALRNYAHHFAISYHRLRRNKNVSE